MNRAVRRRPRTTLAHLRTPLEPPATRSGRPSFDVGGPMAEWQGIETSGLATASALTSAPWALRTVTDNCRAGHAFGAVGGHPPLLMTTLQRTIYCGKPHRLVDGAPIGHSCRLLDPEFLTAEHDTDYLRAASILQNMRLVLHGGVPVKGDVDLPAQGHGVDNLPNVLDPVGGLRERPQHVCDARVGGHAARRLER